MAKIQTNGGHVYEKEYGSRPILLNFKKMKMIKRDTLPLAVRLGIIPNVVRGALTRLFKIQKNI